MNLSAEEVEEFLFDASHANALFSNGKYKVIEIGSWIQDHKYQTQSVIFQCIENERFYQCDIERCGSYHTDWFYTAIEHNEGIKCTEVKQVEVTKTEWRFK